MQQTDFRHYTLEDVLPKEDLTWRKYMLSSSTIHFNIRSLSANHDSLTTLLPDLQYTFADIGLAETRIKNNCDPTSNMTINGYDIVSKPINLNVFHKITEKLMYKRLLNFPDNHNILNENQLGFHSGRSTTQAAMLITDKIQQAIKAKLDSCGIF